MGLKTKNYIIEKSGIVLENAYAVVKKLIVDRGKGVAIIGISNSRDNAINKEPLDEVKIKFTYDIDVDNIVQKAYETARGKKYVEKYDWENQQFYYEEEDMPFHGWENDYYGVTDE